VLLHRGADSPQLTGCYERGFPGEPADVTLRYHTIRVWEVPAAQWLAGGLGLVPLAPLGDVRQDQLPAVIDQMKRRFDREAPHRVAELWLGTYILMGTRYSDALIDTLLQGVIGMEASVTYQKIIRKGKAEGEINEARKILLLQGRNRFGDPPPEALASLNALTDVRQLEELGVRLLQASSWQELLGLPSPRRRSARRKASS